MIDKADAIILALEVAIIPVQHPESYNTEMYLKINLPLAIQMIIDNYKGDK